MLWRTSKGRAFIIAFTLGATAAFHGVKAETAFTAGVVMERMPQNERFAFIAGVIEGLANARFEADGRDPAGMNCIYDWFYGDAKGSSKIYESFRRYPDQYPGRIVGVLLRSACEVQ